MLPGRLLHRLFPQLVTGTHCSVNYQAAQVVSNQASIEKFPHWSLINTYEGMNGVDGLWLNEKILSSFSTYNPDTNQGNGIAAIIEQFDLLAAVPQRSLADVAKYSAYLSHIVTDIYTPPHQHGQLIEPRQRRWYGLWPIRDDWQEGHQWGHTKFEWMALLRLLTKSFRRGRLNKSLIRQWQRTSDSRIVLQTFFQQQTKAVRRLNIYPEYLRLGWTKRIDISMRRVVIPRIVSTVATLWYLAALKRSAPHHYW
ncbi:MAG: hypothetical protein HYV33_05290 [Candidatus Kerfeldbacteria bacterium]|nr:hypothetical protein [Candidatus Kerfeldbacteria bacterium]